MTSEESEARPTLTVLPHALIARVLPGTRVLLGRRVRTLLCRLLNDVQHVFFRSRHSPCFLSTDSIVASALTHNIDAIDQKVSVCISLSSEDAYYGTLDGRLALGYFLGFLAALSLLHAKLIHVDLAGLDICLQKTILTGSRADCRSVSISDTSTSRTMSCMTRTQICSFERSELAVHN